MDEVSQKKLLAYRRYLLAAYPRNESRINQLGKHLLPWLPKVLFSAPKPLNTDVLFLHGYAGAQQRLDTLTRTIESHKLRVRHKDLLPLRSVILNREISHCDQDLHPDLIGMASYARYLVDAFRPKVLVTMTNDSLLSPFLKRFMKGIGTYVNIAHGVVPNEPGHDMIDFDYSFLFGQSSLDNLLKNNVRVGTAKVIFTGSPFYQPKDVRNQFLRHETDSRIRRILLLTQWSPNLQSLMRLQEDAIAMILNWLPHSPATELQVKLHPLDPTDKIARVFEKSNSVTILPKSVSLFEALHANHVVLHLWSNSSIEAASLGIPSISLTKSSYAQDYLHIGQFFGPPAENAEQLESAIDCLFQDLDNGSKQAIRYFQHHIHRDDSIEYIANCLVRLAQGKSLDEAITLKEELAGLQPYISPSDLTPSRGTDG